MKLMPEYNEKNGVTLHYAEKSVLEVAKVTSPHVPNQCLTINFNIFNDKKYCVA